MKENKRSIIGKSKLFTTILKYITKIDAVAKEANSLITIFISPNISSHSATKYSGAKEINS